MTHETVVADQEYILSIHVDPEFLSNENTVYPIVIDPTIEINYDSNGAGAISDVTINSQDTSSPSSGSLFVGLRDPYGISRTLMRFPGLNLSSLPSNITVTNASVKLRDMICESTELEVSCYVFAGNAWTESNVGWTTVDPNNISTFLSSNVISYANGKKQPTAHWYTFDITAAVEGWRVGNYDQNKGIIFRASSSVENGTTLNSRTFASYNRSSKKPTLTVTYIENQSNFNGIHYLNNKYSGGYLSHADTIVSGISGTINNLEDSVRWEIIPIGNSYVIRNSDDSTKLLGVPYQVSSSSVSIMTVQDAIIPDNCIWMITAALNGGGLICNCYNNRYLYTVGNTVLTSDELGSQWTDKYDKRVWRIVDTSYYGNRIIWR